MEVNTTIKMSPAEWRTLLMFAKNYAHRKGELIGHLDMPVADALMNPELERATMVSIREPIK